MSEQTWRALQKSEIFRILKTSDKGLTFEDAKKRLDEFGANELARKKKDSLARMFFRQFKSFLIIILIVATLASFVVGELFNGIMILAILFVNAFFGFFQEYKAEKSIEALKKMTSPKAIALRDGVKQEIPANELVAGDIVYLGEGKSVPADLRLFETHNLKIDESVLTGESLPVMKHEGAIKKEVPLSEITNMAFLGTNVTYGHGIGVVVETGMHTEMGKIAEIVEKTGSEDTPLKKKLDRLGKNLGVIILVLIAFVSMLNLYTNSKGIVDLFILAIAMAISAVPEGLPMIVTLTLAMGMKEMARNNAVIRKLMAVETLGTTTVICSDKTGTLTKNEMTVRKIFADNKFIEVTGFGYNPIGDFLENSKKIDILKNKAFAELVKTGVLCSNAEIIDKNLWKVVGDPTESALVTLAEKAKIDVTKLRGESELVSEVPFSSQRKMMSMLRSSKKTQISYVKGAPEKIIANCSHILEDGKVKKISKGQKKKLEQIAEKMAGEPLRVLGFAFKKISNAKKYSFKTMESELVFLGLAGMVDPPREGVKEAIKTCNTAGIRTVMITGDHKTTAVSVAKKIGLITKGEMAITGMELESMSLDELEGLVDKVAVYARVSPEHKVKILQALEAKGEIVAMTGDGVNDAPALKRAHIGIAMGIKGTDVAKQASDMILKDDNFSTIVKAVECGRKIYDNIKKFVRFELAANFDEVALISFAAIAGMPLPLLPLQLLWINLVTDTIPATTLAVDPAEKDIMKRHPRRRENIISSMLPFLLTTITISTFIDIWLFLWGLPFGIQKARTLVFTGTVMFQLFLVFNVRSETKPLVLTNPFENRYLLLGVASSFLLQLSVIYIAPLQAIFGTFPLDLTDWVVVLLFASIALAVSPSLFKKKSKRISRS